MKKIPAHPFTGWAGILIFKGKSLVIGCHRQFHLLGTEHPDLSAFIELDEKHHQFGVKLFSGLLAQDGDRLFAGKGISVGTLRRHRIKGIRDAEDPAHDGDLLSAQAARITAAVIALVVRQHRRNDVIQRGQVPDDVDRVLHVSLDALVLFIRKPVGLIKDILFNADLSDVMQEGSLFVLKIPEQWFL